MIIYTREGVRHAVVIALPFIICIQKQYMNKMTCHSEKIERISINPSKPKVLYFTTSIFNS